MEAKEFYSQSKEVETGVFDFGQYRVGHYIRKNIEKSSENEDSIYFYGVEDNWVCGVSDGVGGHPRGKDASEIASLGVLNYFKKNGFSHQIFLRNLEAVNEKIRDLKVGAKTTHSAALLKKHELRIYSIGDSEVLLSNTKGQLIYSNIPQSPVGYGVEAGYLDQSEALDDPQRHLVNHLLGDEILRFEASSSIGFKKGYSLLIGSDGIFDNHDHEKLLDIIGGGAFDESFEALCKLCDEKQTEQRKDDDVSFFFIRRVRSE